jgi:hypothetical protein
MCRRPSLYRTQAVDQLYRRDFDGFRGCANYHEFTGHAKAIDQSGHRLAAWRRGENCPGPTHLLQFFSRVGLIGRDVGLRAELQGEIFPLPPRPIATVR